MPIEPYGGTLVDRRLGEAEAEAARTRAPSIPHVKLSNVALSDLYLIAVGGFSPLRGFMGKEEYDSVVDDMTLPDGLPWTIPVTLPVSDDDAAELDVGGEVALYTDDGEVAAIMTVEEIFERDLEREAQQVYGTTERKHPGVARLDGEGKRLVGGPIDYVLGRDITGVPQDHMTPARAREEFESRGWETVVAFQTRNPVHRAHEYLQKCALEIVDGLLLHPLVGDTKSDDVPADVRMDCYHAVLDNYFPEDRVVLSVLPAAMRYAGPREAIFHAIMRRNYGCTHFIVGRDHAGVGDYYGTYEAQEMFDRIDGEALGIKPLKFEHSMFCTVCDQMVSRKTCPHPGENHIFLSGTKVREMLAKGERPPPEFSRPEVAEVLVQAYAGS